MDRRLALQRCLSCGATYAPTSADDAPYFHVCAPLSVAELRAALDAGTVALTDAQRATLDRAAAADVDAPPAAGQASAVDRAWASLHVERPHARNENVNRAARLEAEHAAQFGKLDIPTPRPRPTPDAQLTSVGAGVVAHDPDATD